jgi:hypothetical protein
VFSIRMSSIAVRIGATHIDQPGTR